MNAIPNEYDGPRLPAKRLKAKQFALDFAYADSAAELDQGVRETIRGVKMSIMAMGIALYRIQTTERKPEKISGGYRQSKEKGCQ